MATDKFLTVESLRIQDPRSKKYLHLSAGHMSFYDTRGHLRMTLELYSEWDDEPRITLYDHNGNERFAVVLEGNGNPYLALNDGNGNGRIGMHMLSDENIPQLFLNDANETARLEINVDIDNDPDITFSDRNGDRRLVLDFDDYKGHSPLRRYDAEGKETYRLPVPQDTKEED